MQPSTSTVPPELAALRERAEELGSLARVQALLFWDQNTVMPPRGAAARGDHQAALQTIAHRKLCDPELARLLSALEPWAAGQDPDGDDVRLVEVLRRDVEKAQRVPTALAAEMSRAAATGQAAWQEARAAADFGRFRDAMVRQVELRHRYAACFPEAAHPYDVLLDDFEAGMTVARLRPLLEEVRTGLLPLIDAATAVADGRPSVLAGHFEVDVQRRAAMAVLERIGFDPDSWRLDAAPHPFAQGIGPGDTRITTRYDLHDFAGAYFGCLHEFGHGLYEANVPARLTATPLGDPVSLGVHESQSRLWENVIGRGRPFCAWVLPVLADALPGLHRADADALYRSVNAVARSLIRVEADETTYNLHIVLRFELELAVVEGTLAVDDLPHAWNQGMHRLLGLDVPDDAQGVLQDVHWGAGLIGYFPTYTLGNLIAAQLWDALRAELPDVEAGIARGEFEPLREWLRTRIHEHGRKFPPDELVRRAAGADLSVEPFLRYLRDKLADAGVPAPG
ncbi:MAG TPA: carboxypeptidase M32 [Solirubrobacteraceae bacterium]|nr:carboxypeptidase M32 [Solirubrobacteraceae bacterium]